MNFSNFNVHGPDVSYCQDYEGTPQMIDFRKMKQAGADFVIVKAGQRNYADPDFLYNWREAKAAGIPRGSYWFYDSRETPKRQAEKYWTLLEPDPGELFHAADWEENYNGPYRDWQYLYDFLFWFKEFSNLPYEFIPIYTGYFYWLEHAPTNVLSLEWFKRHPLWMGNYNPQVLVKIPPPWSKCVLWQFGTPSVGLEYGAESKEIDMNLWNGDKASFNSYFGLGGEVIPPTEIEEPMNKWYRVTAAVLNLRDGAGAGNRDVGDLINGDLIEVSETVAGWHHIVNIWRAGGFTTCPPVAWCSGAYTVETATPVIPPVEPPAETDAVYVDIEADVTATFNGKQYHGVVAFGNLQLKIVE